MGITIAYKGKLNNPDLVYPFCNELSDIADNMNWKYQILDEDYNRPHTAYVDKKSPGFHIKGHLALKGISINIHPDSELLSFYFDREGNIRNIILMVTEGDNGNLEIEYGFIKTQYAPVEVHITVVKLLRYIKKKYIADLYVEDEGMYWETNDEKILIEKMEFLRKKINEVKDILDKADITREESPISLADQIEKILIDKFDNNYNGNEMKNEGKE